MLCLLVMESVPKLYISLGLDGGRSCPIQMSGCIFVVIGCSRLEMPADAISCVPVLSETLAGNYVGWDLLYAEINR